MCYNGIMIHPAFYADTIIGYLEGSLAQTATSTALATHRDHERARGHGLKRAARMALLELATGHPTATAKLLNRSLPPNISYAGAGSNMIAYRTTKDDNVRKVYKRSIHMAEPGQRELVTTETARHQIIRRYLGDIMLPQKIEVAPHPVIACRNIVQIVQPFCEYQPLDQVFPTAQSSIDKDALSAVLKVTPALDEPLYTLATQGLLMASEMGLVPDVSGRGNLGVPIRASAPGIVLIDGQPCDFTSECTTQSVIPQLEQLRQYLDVPHLT